MLFELVSPDTLVLAGVIFLSVYMLGALAFWNNRRREKHEMLSKLNETARLDDYRAHLERQLLDLNMKFSSSERRWQELNHLVVAGQSNNELYKESDFSQGTALFFKSHGLDLKTIRQREDLMFVLTPFHDDLKDEFETVYSVGKTLGFQVLRGDEKLEPGDIFRKILTLVASARIVVANISGRNPNVFYELGIAHALGKQVILLAHSNSHVPFDVQSKPIVFYRNNEELAKNLNSMIGRTMLSGRANPLG
ncbi:hypothetical protein [Pseudomonas helleri]|uniref:hypothetical protein n=1 Tax=Pseudomonas helleri TaxID=1608996 RepID=UPI002490A717|nr:hypothetical protein [Pseudomonas helleri]